MEYLPNVCPIPPTDSVGQGLAALAAGSYDCLVALGGGSSIDTAKAVAAMADRDGPMRDYKVPHLIDTGLPVIGDSHNRGNGL